MQDTPNPVDLIRAVTGFLRDHAMPQLSGHAAFHARVAANTLDIVIRQLQARPIDDPTESARLRRLLGDGATAAYDIARDGPATTTQVDPIGSGDDSDPRGADLVALNRELCRRIADGELTLDSPGLADHLWATTMEKLAVDQPRYESYRRHLPPSPAN